MATVATTSLRSAPAEATSFSPADSLRIEAQRESTQPALTQLTPAEIGAISRKFPDADRRDNIVEKLSSILENKNGTSILTTSQRRQLVSDMIVDIVTVPQPPVMINQGMYATCVPTTRSIHLAQQDPEHYLTLMEGATQKGGIALAVKGMRFEMDPAAIGPDAIRAQPPYANRSFSEQVWQTSAMIAYGRTPGSNLTYNPTTDTSSGHLAGYGTVSYRGQPKGPKEYFDEAILGRGVTRIDMPETPAGRRETISALERQLAAHKGAFVEMHWGDAGSAHELHELYLTRIDHSTSTVQLQNPHGSVETMSLVEFQSRLSSATIFDDSPIGKITPERTRPAPIRPPTEVERNQGIEAVYEFQAPPRPEAQGAFTAPPALSAQGDEGLLDLSVAAKAVNPREVVRDLRRTAQTELRAKRRSIFNDEE